MIAPSLQGLGPPFCPCLPLKDCGRLSFVHTAFPISWLLSTPSLMTVLVGNSFVCSWNVSFESVWLSDLYINSIKSLLVTSLPLLPSPFRLELFSVPSLNCLSLSYSLRPYRNPSVSSATSTSPARCNLPISYFSPFPIASCTSLK